MKKLILSILFLVSIESQAAISNVLLSRQVIGGVHLQLWQATLTSVTSGIIATGLSTIHYAGCSNDTTGDDAGRVQRNKSAASTTTAGNVFVSAFTSGDVLNCLVIGQ